MRALKNRIVKSREKALSIKVLGLATYRQMVGFSTPTELILMIQEPDIRLPSSLNPEQFALSEFLWLTVGAAVVLAMVVRIAKAERKDPGLNTV
jgi:hypothetical protein